MSHILKIVYGQISIVAVTVPWRQHIPRRRMSPKKYIVIITSQSTKPVRVKDSSKSSHSNLSITEQNSVVVCEMCVENISNCRCADAMYTISQWESSTPFTYIWSKCIFNFVVSHVWKNFIIYTNKNVSLINLKLLKRMKCLVKPVNVYLLTIQCL